MADNRHSSNQTVVRSLTIERSWPLAADGKADTDTSRGKRHEVVTIDATGSYSDLRVNLSDRSRYSAAVADWEAEHGAFPDEELAQARARVASAGAKKKRRARRSR